MHRQLLAALVFLASSAAAADFTDLPQIPAFQFKAAPVWARIAGRRPRTAWIAGGMNHSPVQVTFDRVEWTIKGGVNQSPVDLKIDHANGKITGGANHSPVD